MPNVHIPDGSRWSVKQENGDVIATHDTQAEAEQGAKTWLGDNGGGEALHPPQRGRVLARSKGESV